VAERLPTVVLVDDVPEVRALVKTRLRLSGRFDVVAEGSDGVEAVALARTHRPALLLLDVSMPRLDGLGALPQVLEASPGTRVVMYSGFDEQGLAHRAVELGAVGFLEKSTAVETLADDLTSLLGADVEPVAEISTPDDVTDTAALEEHLERFREVFEEAAIGMATMTLTGHVVRANRALAEILGRSLDTIVGASYADLAVPADATDVVTTVESIDADSPDVLRLEHGVVVANRHRRVLATIAPVRDGRRRPLYLFLQVQDVTAQRHAEEQLRQSEERFRLLVETVEDYAIFMLDPTGHVASWNAGAQRIKGYAADEIIGEHFRRFYPDDVQRSGHPEAELAIALARGHYEEEGWRIRKDGSRFWANVVITAIRNADGEHIGFAKVTRDITDRQQMLKDRERAAEALAIANRELELMNARLSRAASDQAEFFAVTAHELRGPAGLLGGSATT
jgi:PAS domain S-box-containing protein